MLRYDQGRQDGAHIDQWEDPKYEIYHMQDRSVQHYNSSYNRDLDSGLQGTVSSTTSACQMWRGGPPGSRKCWRRR